MFTMADRTCLESGIYMGDQNGRSRFKLCYNGRIVQYEHSVANIFKTGSKVVLTTLSKSAHRSVEQVHHPASVVSGTGTVASVSAGFGFISFQQAKHSSLVFFFNRNFDHPDNRPGTPIDKMLPVGTCVKFDAIKQEDRKAEYRAACVTLLEESPPAGSTSSFPNVLKGQRGIIVKICSGISLYIWSKELGLVYAPYSRLERGSKQRLHEGQWLEFDVQKQDPVEGCHWVVINKANLIDHQLDYEITRQKSKGKRLHLTNMQTKDCIGIVTNVFGTDGLLLSPQLGRVFFGKETTKGWSQEEFRAGTRVIFNSERIIKSDYEDIGWRATSIDASPGARVPNCVQRCIAQLIDIPEARCGMLYNKDIGKISFTWMDFFTCVTDEAEFRAAVSKHKYYNVRFIPALQHLAVKWSAVYVRPANPKQLKHQIRKMQDVSCQTEQVPELSLFRLVRDTPVLLNAMKERHKDQIPVLIQMLRNKFKPNHVGAKVEYELIASVDLRNVACQTAASPELELADRLLNDEELVSLLTDIDHELLLSLT